ANVARQPRAHVDLRGENRGMLGNQEDVVEGEGRGEAVGLARRAQLVPEVLDQVIDGVDVAHVAAPWHFLYFLPLPQGQGSLRPIFGSSRRTVFGVASSPPTRGGCCGRAGPNGLAGWGACARAPPKRDDDSDAGSLRMSGGGRRGAGRRGTGASSPIIGRSH